MKKKLISILFCLLLLPVLAVQAAVAPIQDNAGLLTASETEALTRISQEIKEEFDLTAAVLTLNSLDGKTAQSYADDHFEANYGYNGVLFLVDMGSRSWHISTDGAALELLSDDDLEQIENAVVPCLSDGLYSKAFEAYLEILPSLLEEEEADFGGYLLICATPGAVIAAIILLVMKSSMNSKKPRHSAADYTVGGSYHLRSHSDLFLYSSVTKRARPKENKSSGGSTTHRSSSGRSHGGRGGKF